MVGSSQCLARIAGHGLSQPWRLSILPSAYPGKETFLDSLCEMEWHSPYQHEKVPPPSCITVIATICLILPVNHLFCGLLYKHDLFNLYCSNDNKHYYHFGNRETEAQRITVLRSHSLNPGPSLDHQLYTAPKSSWNNLVQLPTWTASTITLLVTL